MKSDSIDIEDVIASCLYRDDAEFIATYEGNRKALLKYRFWNKEKMLSPFCDLSILPVRIDRNRYIYYDKKIKKYSKIFLIHKTKYVEKRFFQDLEKPLLIRNEMNIRHWEYLYDNVRRSEDYGGDNHVYLSYDNINEFILFLCVEDITSYLPMEKFIFLFDREVENYPIDFLKDFNIDYTSAGPTVIRVEEIQRLFVNLGKVACAGNSFFMGILDSHKDIISANGFFGLSDFVFVYRKALYSRTVSEVRKSFFDGDLDKLSNLSLSYMFNGCCMYGEKCICPKEDKFFDCLESIFAVDYRPKEEEWFKGIFLAYSMALGREYTGRISPAIKFETHFVFRFPEENKRWQYNNALFSKFKYCRAMTPVRYFVASQSSIVDKMLSRRYKGNILEELVNRLLGTYIFNSVCQEDGMQYENMLLRFEDFKLHVRESLQSLCEYLDIPWDNALLKITANGTEYMAFGTGAFDPAPLKKRYYNVCNPFDYYRIELVMSKYWKHFGYEPLFYKGEDIYTEEEILKMFELPFQCEQYITDEKEKERIPAIRKKIYELVKKRLHEDDVPLNEKGEKMVPIPWLKPKTEYVDEELYR